MGNRRNFFDSDYQRYVVGINGDFNIKDNGFISRFGYDSGFVYEHYQQQATFTGYPDQDGIIALIGANLFNPFIGQFAPITGNAPTYVNGVPTGMTAPYDNTSARIPIGLGGASSLSHSFFYERDWLADAKVNMHLFPNLWNGGVDLAMGYEHREIQQHSVADFVESPNTKTLQEVNSFFTELNLPIVRSTMNVPFIRSLELALAWRYEKFDDSDSYTKQTGSFDNSNPNEDFGGTPRLSLRYQPIADVTLRASWGQSFRSPFPADLFSPTLEDFPVVFDPVQGNTLQPPLGVWNRGNPNLQPEKTDAYSAGVVWTPKFLPGFTMTVDWYQLFTTDLIVSGNDFAQVLLTTNVIDPDGCGNGSGLRRLPEVRGLE